MGKVSETKLQWEKLNRGYGAEYSSRVGSYELIIWKKNIKRSFSGALYSNHTNQGRRTLASFPLPITAKTLSGAKQRLLSCLVEFVLEEIKATAQILSDEQLADIGLLRRK
jgi:hypothetical protein